MWNWSRLPKDETIFFCVLIALLCILPFIAPAYLYVLANVGMVFGIILYGLSLGEWPKSPPVVKRQTRQS